MHHFGCVVPSWEALELVRLVAGGRAVADVGSGNGYWTFMLRRHGLRVTAVDNMQSTFRVRWVADTVVEDGAAWLRARRGAEDVVLLLVYPVVGAEFVKSMLAEYRGRTLVVAGTQNANGYTAFVDRTIDDYVRLEMPGWRKTVQVALPSFAGKDEALFVFERD